jgi:DNA invertase Pin-like site-specific DNA recombinase
MQPMIYRYARVSTDGQSVDAQVRQLTKAGCKKVFREVATVTRLDRLARFTRDLLNILAAVTGKEAGFRSLGDACADTTTSHGRLMHTVPGGLAEFERDPIGLRTGEGCERAKARGMKMGRKPKPTPHQQREAMRRRDSGEPVLEIARSFNVHQATISRLTA